ncbi:hypothetical protein D3C85_1653960 [compost metagenome]
MIPILCYFQFILKVVPVLQLTVVNVVPSPIMVKFQRQLKKGINKNTIEIKGNGCLMKELIGVYSVMVSVFFFQWKFL